MSEKELLECLVNSSNSLREVLEKLNKAVSGASIKVLKETLDAYGITYHFLNCSSGGILNKLSLEEILVKDRSYKSSDLLRRLVSEGLKEFKCECCGLPPIWNGKPLTLQLDHINGNHNDNRLENLRILCPNCHTLTDTFSSKRLKKTYKCKDCGKEIKRNSTYCRKCAAKYRHNPSLKVKDKPNKLELLDLILNKSFAEIGKIYNVSDNAIRKWCKNYNLPYTKEKIRELF